MLILKIPNVALDSLSGKITNNYDLPKRQIEFSGIVSFTQGQQTRPDFVWKIESGLADTVTKKPQEENITTLSGKKIKCIIFKISCTYGVSSSFLGGMSNEFYLRVYNANVTISKVFLAIAEKERLEEAKIEFVEKRNSEEIQGSGNMIFYEKRPVENLAKNFDCFNKMHIINQNSNQFDVCLMTLFTEHGTAGKPTRVLLQNYDLIKDKSEIDNEDNTVSSKPTFQDFISINQDLIRSDPAIDAGKWQVLIDREKARQTKLLNTAEKFKGHMTDFKTRVALHSTNISDIVK